MRHYTDVVLTGNPLTPSAAAFVTVYNTGTAVKASLFSDRYGVTPLANPVTTDGYGNFAFYVADGRYDLEASKAGQAVVTTRDVDITEDSPTLEIINVSDYGAKGDGVTDDTTAIRAAVAVAAALTASAFLSRASVYFPPGVYKVTSSGVLTQSNAIAPYCGIHFFGAGMRTSVLRLTPSGSDLYFYNNVATARMMFNTFADLGFQGINPASYSVYTDISNNAKGFRLWATTASGAHEMGFQFTRCEFFGLHTCFETAGDNVTSENTFTQCRFTNIKSTVLKTNNAQSFDQEFYGCQLHNIYGDVFQTGASAGGAFKMFGGSVIMQSGASAAWFLNVSAGSGGITDEPTVFSGVKFELLGNNTNLVNTAAGMPTNAVFRDCKFTDSAMATKANYVTVARQATILFARCAWEEQNGEYIKFLLTQVVNSYYGIDGTILFDYCELPVDWSDKCTVTGEGLISARNCFGSNTAATTLGDHWAHDFDLHGLGANVGQYGAWASSSVTDCGSPSHAQWVLKTATMHLENEAWPSAAGWEHNLKLPKNALIKSIHLRKPPGSADATVTIFRVGRNDKSGTDHLVSNSAAFNLSHTQDVTNYFYFVGTTLNERKLRLYTAEAPTGLVQGGMCIVEYY